MDCFKRVESLMKYRLIKTFDTIIVVLVLQRFKIFQKSFVLTKKSGKPF